MRDQTQKKVAKAFCLFAILALVCFQVVQPYFFDNPERGEFRILSEENYHDYVMKRSIAANRRCDSKVDFENFDSIKVETSGDEKVFTIPPGKNAPPIQLLFDVCFDQMKMNDYFDGSTLKFVKMKLNTESKDADIELTGDKIKFADKFEISSDLKIQISVNLNAGAESLKIKKMKVKMTGTVDINDDKIDCETTKEKNTDKFLITKFDYKSSTVKLDPLNGMINGIDDDLDSTALMKESSSLKPDKFEGVEWGSGCNCIGHFYTDNRFQLVCKAVGKIKDTNPFGDIETEQVIALKGDKTGSIVPVYINMFNGTDDSVGDVLSELTTADDKPYRTVMGRLDGVWCLIFTKDPTFLTVKDQREKYKGMLKNCFVDDFERGSNILKFYGAPQVKMQLDFKKNITDCLKKMPADSPRPDLSDLPDTVMATAVQEPIGWKWRFPKNASIPITQYLACVSGISALFKVSPDIFGRRAQITDFYYGLSDQEPVISIACKITPTKPFVPGTNLKFEGVELKYDLEGGEHTIAIESEVRSQKTDFATLARCQNEDNEFQNFRCEIGIPSLTLGEIGEDIFQMKKPEKKIVNRELILNSGVKDLKLIFYMGETEYCRVRGNFQLLKIDGVIVEMVNVKGVGYAFGMYITNFNIEGVIKHFTDLTYEVSLPWLSRCEGLIVYSNFQGKKQDDDDEEDGDDNEDDDDNEDSNDDSTDGDFKRKRREIAAKSPNKFIAGKYKRMQKASKKLRKSPTKHHRRSSKRSAPREPATAPAEIDTSDIAFETPSFSGYEIKPGFSFSFTWKTPKSKDICKKNAICDFLCDKIPGTSLTLAGTFNKDKTFSISASISTDIKLTDHLKFQEASLEIEWGPSVDDRKIAISCEMAYVDPKSFKDPLKFIGSIEISLAGSLSLQFGMKGMINEPFSVKNFAIGNIAIGLEVAKSETGITFTLMIGCEIYLGDVKNTPQSEFDEKILSLAGYFGLSPNNPWDSWMYCKANKLTIGKLGKIFGFEEKIPERFRGDGFPEGFLFSLSKKAQEIAPLGIDVEEGCIFQGKFKFWDFQGEANIKLQPLSMTYEVDIKLCVIKWFNGFLQITRLDDETKGPYLKLKMEPGAFEADVNGQLKVLGLTYGAKIQISSGSIYCKVIGTLFPGIFDGYIEIKGQFGVGSEFTGGSIMVGIKTSNAFEKIKEALLEYLGGAKKKAKDCTDEADKVVKQANKEKSDSESETASMQRSIGSWKAKLKKRNEELERKKKSATSVAECQAKCEKVCFPFFTWLSQCFKVWGSWCGCPGWDKCYKMIDNIICLGACVVKAVANAFMTWVEETLNKIAIAMASVAEGLTKVVQGVIDAAKKVAELASGLWDLVKAGLRAIVELVLSAMNFQIRALELKATLKPDLDMCLSVGIDVSFFGMDYKSMHEYELCLSSILKSIINMIIGNSPKTQEVKKVDEKVEEVKGKQEGIKEACSDLDDTRKETEDKVDSETANEYDEELEQKSKLPRPEMFVFIDRLRKKYNNTFTDEQREFIHKPHTMPKYNVHDEKLTKAFKENAPWIHSANYDPFSHNFQPMQDDSEKEVNKRSYIFGESLTPCGRVKRSLGQYSDITNKIMKGVKNMNDVKTHVKIAKRDHINNLANFYSQTHELGTKYDDITEQQRSDIYHWYNKIKDGYMAHLANTKRHLNHHSYHALPVLRSQINYALKKNFNSSFEDFIGEIHGNAVSSYKRSVIPTPQHVKGEEMLHNIKNDLVSIVTSENVPITSYEQKLNDVNANIREMSKYAAKCQDA